MEKNMRLNMKLRKLMTGMVFFVLCTLMFSTSVSEDGLRDTFRENDPAYFKIKAPGNGTIVVQTKVSELPGTDEERIYMDGYGIEGDNLDISILNSKKNVIFAYNFWGEKKYNFSQIVQKNSVYYLKLTGDCQYKIRYTYFPAPKKISKAAHKIEKAKLLKKGATVSSFLDISKKGGIEDTYYKFQIKKQTNVTLAFDTQICGKALPGDHMQVTLYVKKGNSYKCVNNSGESKKDWFLWWDVGGKDKVTFKLPKGTYIVRLWTFEGTGYYSMKWK